MDKPNNVAWFDSIRNEESSWLTGKAVGPCGQVGRMADPSGSTEA